MGGWTGKIGLKRIQLAEEEFKLGGAWGLKKNGELGKVYSYDFESSSVTAPIFNVIKESGWRIKFNFLCWEEAVSKIESFCLSGIYRYSNNIYSFLCVFL